MKIFHRIISIQRVCPPPSSCYLWKIWHEKMKSREKYEKYPLFLLLFLQGARTTSTCTWTSSYMDISCIIISRLSHLLHCNFHSKPIVKRFIRSPSSFTFSYYDFFEYIIINEQRATVNHVGIRFVVSFQKIHEILRNKLNITCSQVQNKFFKNKSQKVEN